MSDEPDAKLRGKCQGGGCAINKTGQTLVVGIWAGENTETSYMCTLTLPSLISPTVHSLLLSHRADPA